MGIGSRSANTAYIIAGLAMLLVVTRVALSGVLGGLAPFLPFVFAVMAAAWYGGLRPGLLATVLGSMAGFIFFVGLSYTFSIEQLADGVHLVLFLLAGICISWLCESLHVAQRKAKADQERLGREVAKRQGAEAALSRSEEQFRALVENMPQYIWSARSDGACDYCNSQFLQFVGKTMEQIQGSGWLELFHPDDVERVRKAWTDAYQNGTDYSVEARLRRASDGMYRWYISRGAPIRDESGKFVHWYGFVTDIHDRKMVESHLQEWKDRYEAAIGASGSIVYDCNRATGHAVYAGGCQTILGYTSEELGGKISKWLELVHPEDRPKFLGEVEATTVEKRSGYLEYRIRRRDGAYILVEDRGNLITDANGESRMIGVIRDVTCQRESERLLRESEAKFRSIFESDLMPMCLWHIDGRILDANDAYLRLIGATQEDLKQGKIRWDAISPGGITQQEKEAHEKMAETGRGHAYEKEFVLADGKRVPVLVGGSHLPGYKDRGFGFAIDLAERKRAEIERKRALATLDALVAAAPVGIAILDRKMRYRLVNKPLAEMNGIPAEAHIGKTVGEIVPDILPSVEPFFLKILETREPVVDYLVEGETAQSPGEKRAWLESWFPVPSTNGETSEFGVFVHEITERRRAEEVQQRQAEELTRQAERLRILWEAAGVLLTTNEPDAMLRGLFAKIAPHLGVDAYFNFLLDETEECLELVSCTGIPDEIARTINRLNFGQAICGSVAQERKPIVASDIQNSGDPKAQLVKAFGIRAYACHPLMIEDRLLGTLSFASHTRDEFNADEIEFMRTICHYVTMAYERLRLMAQLRESDQRKSDFLAVLGHELRNPLAGISNGIQVLKFISPDSQDADEMRQVIDRQATHMTHLIDDLLDVSRISRGKIRLQRKSLDFAQLVRKTVENYRRQMEGQELALSLALPERPVWINADPTRMAQVVGNLLNNCLKFTDPGGMVSVTLKADEMEATASLSVKDTGIGMEPHLVRRLFQPFTQADSSLDRSRAGLGLGLALVKGLVEMHGGEVTACSAGLGQGTEIRVKLPLTEETEAQPSNSTRPPLSKSYRILLIDDRRDAILPLQKMLSVLDQKVEIADSGKVGLEKAREFRPEVVLCDIGLPGMSGYEVAQAMRDDPALRSAYLVAVTGYGQEEDRRRAEEAGFDFHIAKPIGIDRLEMLLAELPRFALA